MAPWLRVLEAYLVAALLRTPAFHRGVEKVARQVHRIRNGFPPEDPNPTKLKNPTEPGFAKHFVQEVKTQLGYAEQQEAKAAARTKPPVVEEERADAAWQNAQKNATQDQKKAFMHEYMDALREQVRNNNNNNKGSS